jgi:sulfur carrier protein
MELLLNGEPHDVAAGTTIADLVLEVNAAHAAVAVAVNTEFVPRSAYADTVLNAGDHIDIVSPQQGG